MESDFSLLKVKSDSIEIFQIVQIINTDGWQKVYQYKGKKVISNVLTFFLGSGELEFEEFCILAARFLIEEDEEQMRKELKEAFRFYDKEGKQNKNFVKSSF